MNPEQNKIDEFIAKWEVQKDIWNTVLNNPLFHTKESLLRASGSSMAITSMLLDFKETFNEKYNDT